MTPTAIDPADAWKGMSIAREPGDCPVCGRDSCEEHLLDKPVSKTNGRANDGTALVFRSVDEIITAPRPVEIVEGIAWAEALTLFTAESGAGKTFVLMDVSAAVTDGIHWHGRTTRPGSVAYCSFEGDALGVRLRALREAKGHRLENLYFVRASAPLTPAFARDGREEYSLGEIIITEALARLASQLATAGKPRVVLVIIDTLRASHSGSEDSSDPISAYLRAVRRIMATVPGAAAIVAHHAGWQDSESSRKRERGSSALRANCDAAMYLEAQEEDRRGEARLILSALKVRDAERPTPLHLLRRRVDILEQDERGFPVTSCVIERDTRTRADREAEMAATAEKEANETDLQTLKAIAEHPELSTSQENIRRLLGLRNAVVSGSISRLIRSGRLKPGKRGQPYQLTDEGQATIRGER